jgi:diguanylate cyclase (GGDEF)-like protein
MAKQSVTLSPIQPDSRVLQTVTQVSNICLIIVGLFATAYLTAWFIPAVGNHFPEGWKAMKVNIALCDLFAAYSLAYCNPKFSARAHFISRILAIIVASICLAVLYQYATGKQIGIDTLIVSDSLSGHPGNMSEQTAGTFLLLAVILLFIKARKNLLSHIIDGLTLCLGLAVLTFTFGYLYCALHLFRLTNENRMGSRTVLGIFLLTIVIFHYRAQYGAFSVLLSDGIAGKTSRLAVPFAFCLPFLLAVLGIVAVNSSVMHNEYASGMATAVVTVLTFWLVLTLSDRIQGLEQDIRDLSLRDELTRLYNRRGFYVLAGQALRLAHRANAPFSVLFMDMDNLKEVNDALGHESGSELLQEMSAILSATFRETDVVGRLGGDEFVVAGNASQDEIALATTRLEAATARANFRPNRLYNISFSYGYVTTDDTRSQTLDDLLSRADKIMYQAKRDKHQGRSRKHVSRFDKPARQWVPYEENSI